MQKFLPGQKVMYNGILCEVISVFNIPPDMKSNHYNLAELTGCNIGYVLSYNNSIRMTGDRYIADPKKIKVYFSVSVYLDNNGKIALNPHYGVNATKCASVYKMIELDLRDKNKDGDILEGVKFNG